MKSSNFFIGLGLIILGLLFLLQNFDYLDVNFANLWPLLVIAAGIAFWIGFIGNRGEYGLLMPGTILIVYGLLFQYSTVYGWYHMQYLWPFFLIGPGLGFFFMYLLGKQESELLIPGSILTILGVFFLLGRIGLWRYWPALLVILGIFLLIRQQRANSGE